MEKEKCILSFAVPIDKSTKGTFYGFILEACHMAKVHEIGSSSIKSVFCLAYQHGFPNHLKNNLGGKVSRRRIRAYIVLYMWGEYFIDILAHKVGKNTNIGYILAMSNLQIMVINV